MAKDRPDEVKRIVTDMTRPGSPCWTVERWGIRFLFIGPEPGKFLFVSVEASDWAHAVQLARTKWNSGATHKWRDTWYGVDGRFTNFKENPE